MATNFNSLSKRQQQYARDITRWAWTQGAQVSVSQVAKDLDTWADAYRAGQVPAAFADKALTLEQAASKLGISVVTVRRYLAPSSDKLARLDGGISARSIERYIEVRRNNIVRTRWVKPAAVRHAA